jgi:DNA repair ATPase RecN
MFDIFKDLTAVVAKVRQRLSVSKRSAQKFDMGRFNLKKLNDVAVKENHQVKIQNRCAALDNLDDDDDVNINMPWKSIRENIKIQSQCLGYCELKQYKPWSDEVCTKLLSDRKQIKW